VVEEIIEKRINIEVVYIGDEEVIIVQLNISIKKLFTL
jgi:hypothetical protein